MLAGCAGTRTEDGQMFTKKADSLYAQYLAGTPEQARQALEATIKLAAAAKLSPFGEADCLCFAYARLYALESKSGRAAAAEADLVRARYWYLRQRELGGATPDEASKAVANFTGEQCMAFVDKWDKDHSGGRGPKYLQSP
jgi:hypothetical protein